MYTIRVIFEVSFSSPAKQFNVIPDIVRSFGGGEIKEPSVLSPTSNRFRLQFKDKKISLYIDPSRYSIVVEETGPTIEQIKKVLIDLSNNLIKRLTWDKMSHIKLVTTRIHEADNFKVLVQRFKENLFTANTLIAKAFDVCMPLTFSHEDACIDFICGPMERPELFKRGFEYPVESPECFAYIDIGYSKVPNQTISIQYLQDFLNVASTFSNDIFTETIAILKV